MSNAKRTETSHRGPAFDAGVLKEGQARDAARRLHPLTADSLQIATPAVRTAFSIVHQVIAQRLPGTNFAGEPRVGKTTAQNIILKTLKSSFGSIPVGHVLATSNSRPSEALFWADMCQSFKLPVLSIREPKRARNKVVNAIVTQCVAAGSDVYVLLGDEVQIWEEAEWSFLKDLGNLLGQEGVRIIHIGFGQHSLHDVKERLRASRRIDLIQRFLKKIYTLAGVMNVEELRRILEQLDNPNFDYPPQSGISYTEFFMPAAYAGGWRLANQADYFWAGFNTVTRRAANKPAANVGMGAVMLALKEFLETCRSEDAPHFQVDAGRWLDAVETTNFAEEVC